MLEVFLVHDWKTKTKNRVVTTRGLGSIPRISEATTLRFRKPQVRPRRAPQRPQLMPPKRLSQTPQP